MANRIRGRLIRLEDVQTGRPQGCRTCRGWGHVLYVFEDGQDPPPCCPDCGRSRPETHAIFEYGLPMDFDRVDPAGLEVVR